LSNIDSAIEQITDKTTITTSFWVSPRDNRAIILNNCKRTCILILVVTVLMLKMLLMAPLTLKKFTLQNELLQRCARMGQ
jgi:hypothetical protein